MEQKTNYLEKEFGIKEDNLYSITFNIINSNFETTIKGTVLNFAPSQMVVKSDKGLYIIKPCNIKEMQPLPTRKFVKEEENIIE